MTEWKRKDSSLLSVVETFAIPYGEKVSDKYIFCQIIAVAEVGDCNGIGITA